MKKNIKSASIGFIALLCLLSQVAFSQETNDLSTTASETIIEENPVGNAWFGLSYGSHYLIFPSINLNTGTDNLFNSGIGIRGNLDYMPLASGFELGADVFIKAEVDSLTELYVGAGPRVLAIFDETFDYENTYMPSIGVVMGVQQPKSNDGSAFVETDISFPFGTEIPLLTLTIGYKAYF